MEMTIPQIVAPQGMPVGKVSPSGPSAPGAAGFQQALVQVIAGQGQSQTEGQTQTSGESAAAAAAGLQALLSAEAGAGAPSSEELLAMVERLIDALDSEGSQDDGVSEADAETLLGQLEALQALMALLGASDVKSIDWNARSFAAGSADAEQAVLLPQIKAALQDTLIQLQDLLQQGGFKRIMGQEPNALISGRLTELAAALFPKSAGGEPSEHGRSERLPSWIQAQPSAAREQTMTLLQRLAGQAANPAAAPDATAFAEDVRSALTAAQQEPAVPAEPMTAAQFTALRQDALRELVSMMPKAAPTASYVIAEEFAQSMADMMIGKFDIRSLNGLSEARLQLFPEQLGSVDVKITMQNGVLTAIFHTDTAMAKDMLENQMAQLRASLQSQGINVDKLEVSHGQTPAGMSQQQQGQGGNMFNGGRGTRGGEGGNGEGGFESELVEQAVIQELGFGRTVNETA